MERDRILSRIQEERRNLMEVEEVAPDLNHVHLINLRLTLLMMDLLVLIEKDLQGLSAGPSASGNSD